MLDEIHAYLDSFKALDIPRLATIHKTRLQNEQSKALKPITKKITSLQKEVALLENEVMKCLLGESAFTEKQLSEIMSEKSNALSALEEEKTFISIKMEATISRIDELVAFRKSALSWKKEFAAADAERQKELIGMTIDRVHISRESMDIAFKYNIFDIEEIYRGKIVRHGGAAPACAIGSSCIGVGTPCGYGAGFGGGGFIGNPLGAVAIIPTHAIACFTHNAI